MRITALAMPTRAHLGFCLCCQRGTPFAKARRFDKQCVICSSMHFRNMSCSVSVFASFVKLQIHITKKGFTLTDLRPICFYEAHDVRCSSCFEFLGARFDPLFAPCVHRPEFVFESLASLYSNKIETRITTTLSINLMWSGVSGVRPHQGSCE